MRGKLGSPSKLSIEKPAPTFGIKAMNISCKGGEMHSSLQILNQAGLNYTMDTTSLRALKTAIKRIYKTNNDLLLD